MQELLSVGDQPVPGYTLKANLGGTAFSRLWKVEGPDSKPRVWKEIDLIVGNAAVETRTLELLVQLRHPKLNTLNNFWNLNDGQTLIIETDVPLMSLADRLQECQTKGLPGIPAEELQVYFLDAAEGLDFLNSPQHNFKGEKVAIYHRALKPECFLLFDVPGRRQCRVSDFGLAKPVTDAEAAHSQGLAHYDFDPPEFFEGVTARQSDQYSLAINWYYLRTGEMPFTGTMLEQLQRRLNNNPKLDKVGSTEREVLKKTLQKDPESRFETCTAFIEALASGATPVLAKSAEPAEPVAPPLKPKSVPLGAAPQTRPPVGEGSKRPPLPPIRTTESGGQAPLGTGRASPVSILGSQPSPTRTPMPQPEPEQQEEEAPAPDVVFRSSTASADRQKSGYTGERPIARPQPQDVQKMRQQLVSQTQRPQRAEVPDDYFTPDDEKKIPVAMAVGIIVAVALLVLFVANQF